MRQTHAPEALQDDVTLLDSDDAVVSGSDARRNSCPCHRDCRISRGVEELGDETAFCREIFSLHSYDLLRQLSLGSGILSKQGIIGGGKYGQQPRRADQLVSFDKASFRGLRMDYISVAASTGAKHKSAHLYKRALQSQHDPALGRGRIDPPRHSQ